MHCPTNLTQVNHIHFWVMAHALLGAAAARRMPFGSCVVTQLVNAVKLSAEAEISSCLLIVHMFP